MENRTKKIYKILKDKDSLMYIMMDLKQKIMPDKRRVITDAKKNGIDEELVKKIILEDFKDSRILDKDKITRFVFMANRGYDIEIMNICFGYMTESYWNYFKEENEREPDYEEWIRLPFLFYVAATYNEFTLSIVEKHLKEIPFLLDRYPALLEFNIDDSEEKYLDIMKKYNKNLPDDLIVWLKLR
jgi:hypothetical protein